MTRLAKAISPTPTTPRMRRQKALALLAVPVFAIALVAAAVPSSDLQGPPPDQTAAAVTQATTASTSQLNISGTVHGTSSTPAEPVRVRVYAWPPNFADSPDGFSLVLLGETQAAADGSFSVRPDYSRLWSEIARARSQTRGPVGEIDIEVVADSASGMSSYSTTAQVTTSTRSMRFDIVTAAEQNSDAPLAASQAARALDADAVVATATRLDASGLRVEMQMLDSAETVVTEPGMVSPAAAPGMIGTCALSRDLGSRLTVVGALGATTTGYSGRMRYTSGATTSVTAGVSATGAYGSFTASGTTSRTSTATVGFPSYTNAGYRLMRTQFNYAIYRCPTGTHTNAFRYVTRVTSFDGGSSPWATTIPAANYCVSQSAGSSFTKNTSTARTMTAAVSGMQSAIGMNMSAQTGYNTAAKAEFSFTSTRRLCGTNGMPGSNPGTLIVKP